MDAYVDGSEIEMRWQRLRASGRWSSRRLLLAAVTAGLVFVATASQASASHGLPYAATFGIADSAGAPAFPGPKALWVGTCDLTSPSTSNGGVGTPPPAFAHCIDPGKAYFPADPGDPNPVPPRETTFQSGFEPQWRLDPHGQAGGHPDATVSMWFQRSPHKPENSAVLLAGDGEPRTIKVGIPPGVMGNPMAIPRCAAALVQVMPPACPPETQVGVATLSIVLGGPTPPVQSVFPIWNVEPRDGKTAEFLLTPASNGGLRVAIPLVAKLRTNDDFGIDTLALELPGGFPVLSSTITIWGVPWAASHDKFRPVASYYGSGGSVAGMPENGLAGGTAMVQGGTDDPVSQEPQPYQPAWGPIRPFLSNMTECSPVAPVTRVEMTSYQNPDVVKGYDVPADVPVSGCGLVPFDPSIDLEPTSTVSDSASGLTVDLQVPQNNNPPAALATNPSDSTGAPAHWRSTAGLATAQLADAVVKLPEGVSVNPSASAGLESCSDAQLGLGSAAEPSCPDGSKIGTVKVDTPLLEEPLEGEVILREPASTDPASGDMFRLALVVRSVKRGLLVKIAGSTVADPQTGRLTTTFEDNPRVTFSHMQLKLKGGPRGILAMPARCGAHSVESSLTPWTAAHGAGGQVSDLLDGWNVSGSCASAFAPSVAVGMSDKTGGGPGQLSFRLSRPQGDQFLSGLSAKLPKGLLASLRGVPLCSNAQVAAAACPAGSRVGSVDAGAGSGTPFFLERKGDVFLTEGYKGAPYGLATVVPVEAGPFRGRWALSTMVVRQALHVDRSTAEVTALSDPFPQVWHGIPLRVREVTVTMDRPGFTRNPTDCSPKSVDTTLTSIDGATAPRSTPFQARGCGALGFKPKLALALTGRGQTRTGKHPGVRAVVTQGAGQAGIARAEVRLPKSLALDPDNARALCEYADGIKPDLESHCPRGSIVGRATASTPLLNRPLSGNVYFVKNVRTDSSTGNQIRTLPMIVVALRGEIAINLVGESSTTRSGRLVNTFAGVPDAPVSRFSLAIKGARNGILTVTRTRRGLIDVCRRRQTAEADIDAHNGRRADQDVTIKRPCPRDSKARTKHAKRKARADARARR